MISETKAYLVGGGIGSLAAAAFMIRDGNIPGANISILEFRFDLETVQSAHCIPCRMPYITSMFMPRLRSDRPLPVPHGSTNFAFISQFVEIADDVVFMVEYSVRAARMAVYELLGIDRKIPPITPHDKSLRTQFEALVKAFK